MNLQIDDGLWYTGAMESVTGGLEEAVLMGKRVAEELRATWTGANMNIRGTKWV